MLSHHRRLHVLRRQLHPAASPSSELAVEACTIELQQVASSSLGETSFEFPELHLEFVDVDEGRSRIARITLANPKALNSISPVMLQSFNLALAKVENVENGVRCLMLTGAGRAFCAGANLSGNHDRVGEGTSAQVFPSVAALQGDKPKRAGQLSTMYHPLFLRLRDLQMPFLAVVSGPCAGVGMSFAAAADLVIASEDAYFLQAFRHRGLVPDGGATYLLPRKVGWTRALELSLLGRRLGAAQALDWGLVNSVVPQAALAEEGMALATELAMGPTKSLAGIRRLYWSAFKNSYEEQLAMEEKEQEMAFARRDSKEGIQAFLDKRKAAFTGT